MAKVARTRNGGTQTESQYWSAIRSALRSKFRYWKPATQALKAAERPSKSTNKRLKYEYKCAKCGKWFKRADVQIDHIIPCGSLRCADDIQAFLERLTPEDSAAFQVLCKKHHSEKTKAERTKRTKK